LEYDAVKDLPGSYDFSLELIWDCDDAADHE